MTPAIEISNLQKTYRGGSAPSVDALSMTVAEGCFFGLLGPNGAGKTTTISILCGLCPFDIGTVRIQGFNVLRDMPKIKSLIGVVPQDVALYPELTVEENLKFFGGLQGLAAKGLSGRIQEYAEAYTFASCLKKKVAHLSGGMKRKVNLSVALLHRPSILFLDEPTVGIDVRSKQEIVQGLRTLNDTGMTIVYTSHDMAEAEQLCSYVALMNRGRIVAEGSPAQLVSAEGVSSLEELFVRKTGDA